MIAKYRYNYCIISNDNINLYTERPSVSYYDTLIENAEIDVDGSQIKVKGDEVVMRFFLEDTLLKDISYEIDDTTKVYFKYKNIIDMIKKIKSPYIKAGVHFLKKRRPFLTIKSGNWVLNFKN